MHCPCKTFSVALLVAANGVFIFPDKSGRYTRISGKRQLRSCAVPSCAGNGQSALPGVRSSVRSWDNNNSGFSPLHPLSLRPAPDFTFGRQGLSCKPCFNRPFRHQQRVFSVFHVPHNLPGGSPVLYPEQFTNV